MDKVKRNETATEVENRKDLTALRIAGYADNNDYLSFRGNNFAEERSCSLRLRNADFKSSSPGLTPFFFFNAK